MENRISPTIKDLENLMNGIKTSKYNTIQLVRCVICGDIFNLYDNETHCKCFKQYKLYFE